jgi:hypothetical protein
MTSSKSAVCRSLRHCFGMLSSLALVLTYQDGQGMLLCMPLQCVGVWSGYGPVRPLTYHTMTQFAHTLGIALVCCMWLQASGFCGCPALLMQWSKSNAQVGGRLGHRGMRVHTSANQRSTQMRDKRHEVGGPQQHWPPALRGSSLSRSSIGLGFTPRDRPGRGVAHDSSAAVCRSVRRCFHHRARGLHTRASIQRHAGY